MIQITSEIKSDLKFIESSIAIGGFGNLIQRDIRTIHDKIKIISKYTDNILLIHQHEIISNEEFLNKVYDIIESYPQFNLKFLCATSTELKHSISPLVSLIQWKDLTTRQYISWNFNKTENIFNQTNFIKSNKIHKGIFSVRKQSNVRDYIFSNLHTSKFDGIIRYAKWSINTQEETPYQKTEMYKKFPTFLELIDEYKKSYVSFVIESKESDTMNPLTEKTLISFLTRTMPIILNGRNYIKELSKMGFYVFNDEFGFDIEDDLLPSFSETRYNKFLYCIKRYNKMSKKDISNMYSNNIEKINHNYILANYFINNSLKFPVKYLENIT